MGVRAQTGNENPEPDLGSGAKKAGDWEVLDHSHLSIDQGGHRRERAERRGGEGRKRSCPSVGNAFAKDFFNLIESVYSFVYLYETLRLGVLAQEGHGVEMTLLRERLN